jgi:NitT/TauT family transport system substrate-binding protein
MKVQLMFVCMVLTVLAATAQATEQVTVRLKWFNQAQFAGFYVAKEKGFYMQNGLDVSIQPGGPNFPAIQMVAGGNEQFGVSGADQILVARGKGVPVVALAVLYRKNPFVLFSLKSSGIAKVSQFCGKRIGAKLGGNEELIYRDMLANAGVSSTCLTEVPVQFDVTPLLTGQVDVWPGYVINEVLQVQEKGHPVNIIWPDQYGVHMYADTLFTTERMLKDKPEVVKHFVAATIQGWNYAVKHPEEAAKFSVKYGNDLTYAHELAMMKASIQFLKPDKAPIGYMEPERWNELQELLLKGGFLKKALDIKQAYTSAYTAN